MYHLTAEVYDKGHVDPQALAAVSRLAGNAYASIGDIFELKRPE